MRRQQFRSTQTALRNTTNASDPSQLVHSFDYGLNPSLPAKSSPLGSSSIAGIPLDLLDRIKAFPLFLSAPESFLLHIGRSLRPSVFQPSQEIIREGEDSKAIYWLVRGSVRVTSRDGESTYAELKPGSFFGEIGVLMDIPRTASILATVKSLVVRLNKEDLRKELPNYPEVEKAIREEAVERLSILERKKKEVKSNDAAARSGAIVIHSTPRKRSRDWAAGDVEMGEAGTIHNGEVMSVKRRKSPTPGIAELAASSSLGTEPPLTVRQLLKELPLFSGLPNDILHFLGVNAKPVTFPPFVEIFKQGSTGRDVYFIIKGDVEILTKAVDSGRSTAQQPGVDDTHLRFRARLKAGQYFGEVTSLSLSPRRTATVRTVDNVECLLISGDTLDDLWQRCSPALKQQVEHEAKRRLDLAKIDEDVEMTETADENEDGFQDASHWRAALPKVRLDTELKDSLNAQLPKMEPLDPDPFFNPDLDNMRMKSRRASLAPPTPLSDGQQSPPQDSNSIRIPSPPIVRLHSPSPLRPKEIASPTLSASQYPSPTFSRRPSLARIASDIGRGRLPDSVLVHICRYLDLLDLMRLRLVSMHWHNTISSSQDILHDLDLSHYNKYITDATLRDHIVPFVGTRPRRVDLSNCFHITDDGFKLLAEACGANVVLWKMKSVWDVSGPAVLSLVDKAKNLEEVDLSNCRKVGDNLLARVVGWVVPEHRSPPPPPPKALAKRPALHRNATPTAPAGQSTPPPGTVIGASRLKRLTLSYCKHIQDRSMAHLAMHASERLESLDLTRCTSISDNGFQSWGMYNFKNMKRLVLADCTYLTDQAIVGIVGGCRGLRELDLSFCCALSDTATEVLALGLPSLRRLNMAFCGSAVSDNSLRCIARHLLELRYLSVRGCVRVTGQGVESVVEGCSHLEEFDVSQCKNLRPWLQRGGTRIVNQARPRGLGRNILFDTVADGTWRTSK